MSTTNTTRTPYLQYLVNTSPIAKHIEDTLGTPKVEEMLLNGTLGSFILKEKMVTPAEYSAFYAAIERANNHFTECDMYDDFYYNYLYVFDDSEARKIDHYRKNRARRHRKALKNEKRGVFNSKAFYRDRDGIYDKLEKQSQLKRAMAKDLRAQENEYYLISIEPELISESKNISKPSATETHLPTQQSHAKTPDELIGEAFKNGYNAGYDDGFTNGTETARRDSYVAGFEAGYAAAMRKVKEELAKFSDSL